MGYIFENHFQGTYTNFALVAMKIKLKIKPSAEKFRRLHYLVLRA